MGREIIQAVRVAYVKASRPRQAENFLENVSDSLYASGEGTCVFFLKFGERLEREQPVPKKGSILGGPGTSWVDSCQRKILSTLGRIGIGLGFQTQLFRFSELNMPLEQSGRFPCFTWNVEKLFIRSIRIMKTDTYVVLNRCKTLPNTLYLEVYLS